MRLAAISVSRYRSILDAAKVEFDDFTVLIGQNNEGKSNFLRALQISFSVIKDCADQFQFSDFPLRPRFRDYDWDRDYPLSYRNREKGRRDTTFRVSFELNDSEKEDFLHRFGSRLSTSLTIEIVLGEKARPKIRWAKQGQSAGKLDSRMNELAAFVQDRFTFLYIPAVRTESESSAAVANLVSKKLSAAMRSEEYVQTYQRLRELERPVFDQIGADTLTTIQSFLPKITSVRFDRREVPSSVRAVARDVTIHVDDGNETPLALKGDGVKSIIAIALFKHGVPDATSSMLAIEEPEAHLHAGAIHELKSVLRQIGQNSQVLITTHSHAFVARDRISSNIIVHGGRVTGAKNVQEIRDLMGVRASDNLRSAEHVILVEGRSDERILSKIFSFRSQKFSSAVKNGHLVVESLNSASKLAHRAGTLRRELFSFLAILDSDESGIAAVKDALKAACIEEHEYKMINVIGMPQSEIEDVIKPEVYLPEVAAKYGLTLARMTVPGNGKWSNRMREMFHAQGKIWDDTVKGDLKNLVASAVEVYPDDPVANPRGDVIATIVEAVEILIGGPSPSLAEAGEAPA